jgi:hypothetical protein
MIGISAPRMFVPVSGGSGTPGAAVRKAYVPYDKDVEISIVSETLALTDETGQALKRGGDTLRARVPRGQPERRLAITVSGVVGE